MRIVDINLRTSIVVASNALSEIVGLYLAFAFTEVIARPFPVELVLVVAHKHGSSDQTCTRSRSQFNIDTSKHKILVCPNVWRIIAFVECEHGTICRAEIDGSIVGGNPITRGN